MLLWLMNMDFAGGGGGAPPSIGQATMFRDSRRRIILLPLLARLLADIFKVTL